MKHLAIRNPDLKFPADHPNPNPKGRMGCWNTVILTACGILSEPPHGKYGLTGRLDMVECARCLTWAKKNPNAIENDGHGHMVTA